MEEVEVEKRSSSGMTWDILILRHTSLHTVQRKTQNYSMKGSTMTDYSMYTRVRPSIDPR